jgi:hypothetical protein
MDIHQIGYHLQNFIIKYDDILLEEHSIELKQHFQFLRKFKDSILKLTTEYGYHWSICPYTSEIIQDVPDTCECVTADNVMLRIAKLMKLYERIRQ